MIEIIIIATILVIGCIASEIDSFSGGAFTLVALVTLVQLWFGINIWASFLASPTLAVIILVAYIAVGMAYAVFVRFPRFLSAQQNQIDSAWTQFKRDNPGAEQDEQAFRDNHRFRPFTASANEHRIAAWTMLWPWGVTWDATNRPVRWIYAKLARLASGWLIRAENKAINRVTKKGH
jgi:hypothetical protein